MSQPLGKSLGGGFVPWTGLEEALDPPIRALVATLNASGWAKTIFSCGGHPEEPDAVTRGRRQAHVDLVVGDTARWKRFVSDVRRSAPRGVRVVEGDLGPLPAWLSQALDQGADQSPHQGRDTNRWRYRRLVFEPQPYSMPAADCRRVLDEALAAALEALPPRDPRQTKQ